MAIMIGLAFGVLVLSGLLLALPRTDGCLAQLGRWAVLLVGAAAPVGLLWRPPASLVDWLLLMAALLLAMAGVTLAAAAWGAALGRHYRRQAKPARRGKKQQTPPPEEVELDDIPMFNPFDMALNPQMVRGSNTLDDAIGGCMLAIVMTVIGLLLGLGMTLGLLLRDYALPKLGTPARRAARALLAAVYGLALYGAAIGLMRPA